MWESIEKVIKFNEAFYLPVGVRPRLINSEDFTLQFKLAQEENIEYLEECNNKDLVEIADALGDQLYILLGTIIKHGLQDKIEPIFNEIHRSNMSKLDDDGKPVINGKNGVHDPTKPIGKVLKSKNYFKPDIKSILEDE